MEQIIIGVDPHKLSATIEVVDDRERFLGSGQFTTDQAGYTAMLPASCAARSSAKAMTGRNQHTESTLYPGRHYVEAYVVKSGVVMASDHHEVHII